MEHIPNIVGLLGVGIILFYYCLLQMGKSKSKDLSFSLMNAVGALCILYSLMYEWNLPTVVIETLWFFISLYGVYKHFRLKK